MNIPRAELAERLLPHLSLTVGRGCVELLTLASLPTTGGWAQSAAVALADLAAKGLARHQLREGQVKAHYFATATTSASEEVALPDLDATLSLVTTTGRPHGAPTDRVTLAITVTLGASWPPGTTPPPRWSKACLLPHVAAELPAIRTTGIDRMRSALLALRSTPSPAPEVSVSKKKITPILTDQLLAYCAGVENGPREGSIHLWLRTRDVPRVDAEALLKSLVEERRLERREKAVAGETIVRYAVVDSSVEPAPLPRSDAPEPANDDGDPGDPKDDEGAEDDPRAAFDEDPPEEEACQRCERRHEQLVVVRQERDDALAEASVYYDAICEVVPDLRGTSPRHLAGGLGEAVRDLRREREEARAHLQTVGLDARLSDALLREVARAIGCESTRRDVLLLAAHKLREERDEACVRHGRLCDHLRDRLALDERDDESMIVGAVGLLVSAADARRTAPTVDPGAVGQYLLTLPGDRWEALTLARQHLAEAKSLAARAQELEAQALAAVDSLLDTTAGQAPAEPPPPPVEAPPVAAPSGETVREEAPAGPRWTSPPAYGETRSRIEEVLQSQSTITLPELLEVCCVSMSGARAALNKLEHEGKITIHRGSPWIITARRARRAA